MGVDAHVLRAPCAVVREERHVPGSRLVGGGAPGQGSALGERLPFPSNSRGHGVSRGQKMATRGSGRHWWWSQLRRRDRRDSGKRGWDLVCTFPPSNIHNIGISDLKKISGCGPRVICWATASRALETQRNHARSSAISQKDPRWRSLDEGDTAALEKLRTFGAP